MTKARDNANEAFEAINDALSKHLLATKDDAVQQAKLADYLARREKAHDSWLGAPGELKALSELAEAAHKTAKALYKSTRDLSKAKARLWNAIDTATGLEPCGNCSLGDEERDEMNRQLDRSNSRAEELADALEAAQDGGDNE